MMSAAKNSSSDAHCFKNGCKWTDTEDRILDKEFTIHNNYARISYQLNRSVDALQARMVKRFIYPKIKFIFYEHEKFNKEYFNRFYHGVVEDYSKQYKIDKEKFMLYLRYADRNLNPKNLDPDAKKPSDESKVLECVYNKSSNKQKKEEPKEKKFWSYVDINGANNEESEESEESDESDESDNDIDDPDYNSETDAESYTSYTSCTSSDIDLSYLDDIQHKLKKLKNLAIINRKLDLLNHKIDKLLKRKV